VSVPVPPNPAAIDSPVTTCPRPIKTARKVLVLGATSGIAMPVCRILAKQGAQLFLVARNAEKLAPLAAELKTLGAAYVDTAIADLDVTADHPDLLTYAVNSLGGCDVALLAQGVLGETHVLDVDFNVANGLLQTNLIASISLCTWLAKYFVSRRAGVLAVISSVAGERGYMRNAVYCASKAGLTAYLSGLRQRIDREGVTVLAILPGPVRTQMTAGVPFQRKFADPDKVAVQIVHAMDRRRDVLYTPRFWRIIMFLVRSLPEFLFKRLKT